MPSDVSEHSLPETLDGTNAHAMNAARTRQDNVATSTIFGEFSEPNHRILERVDKVQPVIDFFKISGGPFTGSVVKACKQQASFTKFVINMKQVAIKAVKDGPQRQRMPQ